MVRIYTAHVAVTPRFKNPFINVLDWNIRIDMAISEAAKSQ